MSPIKTPSDDHSNLLPLYLTKTYKISLQKSDLTNCYQPIQGPFSSQEHLLWRGLCISAMPWWPWWWWWCQCSYRALKNNNKEIIEQNAGLRFPPPLSCTRFFAPDKNKKWSVEFFAFFAPCNYTVALVLIMWLIITDKKQVLLDATQEWKKRQHFSTHNAPLSLAHSLSQSVAIKNSAAKIFVLAVIMCAPREQQWG